MLDDQIPWCSIERTIIRRFSAALIKCVEILIRLILLSDLYTRRSNTWTTALSNQRLNQRRIPVILPLRCPDSEIGLGLFSSTLTLWTVLYSSYLLSAYKLNASCCDIDRIICSRTGKEDERKLNVDSSSTIAPSLRGERHRMQWLRRGKQCDKSSVIA